MKKFLSVLLTAAMLLSMLPAMGLTALADGTLDNPFVDISAYASRDLIYNTDGWMTEEDSIQYFYYNWDATIQITVTPADGSDAITGGFNEVQDIIRERYGEEYTMGAYNAPGPNQQWDIGIHTITLNLLDLSCDVDFNVVKSPVKSLTGVMNMPLVENIHGYTASTDTPEGEVEYFHYDWWNYVTYTAEMENGDIITGSESDLHEYVNYEYSCSWNDEQGLDGTAWEVDTHTVSVSFMGATTEVEITMEENPFESVCARPVRDPLHMVDCYEQEDWNTDPPTTYSYYDWPSCLEYDVVCKNGDTYSGDTAYLEELFPGMTMPFYRDDQSADNVWGVGTHDVSLTILGHTVNTQITVAANPIQSITASMDQKLYKNYNGWITYDGDNEENSYFLYDWWNYVTLHINYVNGESDDIKAFDLSDMFGYSMNYDYCQSYEAPWSVGTHTVELSFMGHTTTLEVEVSPSPVISMNVILDNALEENVDGNVTTDDNTGEEYFQYDWWNYARVEATFTEGFIDNPDNIFTGMLYELSEAFDYRYDYTYTDNQSATNPWEPGEHTGTVTFIGYEAPVNITVEESRILDVTAKMTKKLWVEGDGYTVDSYNGRYFYYTWYDFVEYTVTLKGGDTFTGNEYEIYNEFGTYPSYWDNQTSDNPWGVGDHEITVSLLGRDIDLTITVEKAPIKSISAKSMLPLRYRIDCYTAQEYDNQSGELLGEYYAYEWRSTLNVTVTMKDGTVYSGEIYDIEEAFHHDYQVNIDDAQSYTTPWGIGAHTVTVSFLGLTCTTKVTVVANDIEAITAKADRVAYDNIDGHRVHEPDEYDGPMNPAYLFTTFTVTYGGGKTFTGTAAQIAGRFGVPPTVTLDDNCQNTALLGKHTVILELAGVKGQATFQMATSPYTALTLRDEGKLYLDFTKTDGSTDTVTVLSYVYGVSTSDTEYRLFLNTNRGYYPVEVSSDEEDYNANVQFIIGDLTSSTLEHTLWLQKQNWSSSIASYCKYATSYNGTVNADNINLLLSLAFYVTGEMYEEWPGVEGDDDEYYLKVPADVALDTLNQLIDADNVDISLANTDSATGQVLITYIGGRGGMNSDDTYTYANDGSFVYELTSWDYLNGWVTDKVQTKFSADGKLTALNWTAVAPPAPTVKKITTNAVTLDTVYGYEYRIAGGKWQASPSFTGLKPGTAYTFYIRAKETSYSPAGKASAGRKATTQLSTPKVTVANSNTGITVKWNKITGANTGYFIYRREVKNGEWTGWKQLKGRNANATSWTDTTAKAGVYYRYTVRAVNGSVKSGYEAGTTLRRLTTPKVSIANSDSGVTVKWNKITGATTGYYIYRREIKNNKWTGWKQLKGRNANATSWVDTTAKNGVTYCYTVRAVSGSSTSAYTTTGSLCRLTTPVVKVTKASNGVKVSWNKNTAATKGYWVYRRQLVNGKWSGWSRIKGRSASATSYVDTTAKKSVTYQYTVRSANGNYLSAYKASSNIKR